MEHNGTGRRTIVPARKRVEVEVNGETVLITDWSLDDGPFGSPDGQYLTFILEEEVSPPGNTDGTRGMFRSVLYSVRADGSELTRQFTTSDNSSQVQQAICCPTWSPDSRWIAFSDYQVNSESEGTLDQTIYTVQPDGSELQPRVELTVAASGGSLKGLSWSPKDPELLFTRGLNRNMGEVNIADLHSGEIRKIVDGSYASWSPDGSRIAVLSASSEDYLFTVDPEGKNRLVLLTINEDLELKTANE